MIIFGTTEQKFKDLGTVFPSTCPTCNNLVYYHYIRSRQWFHIYFIPIFPDNTHHMILCPHCNCGFEIKNIRSIKILKEMIIGTSMFFSKKVNEEDYLEYVNSKLEILRKNKLYPIRI